MSGPEVLWPLRLLAGLAVVFGFAGWVGLDRLLGNAMPFIALMLLPAALVAAALCWGARRLLRGNAKGRLEALIYAPVLALWGTGVIALANEKLDTSPAVEHDARVTRVETKRLKTFQGPELIGTLYLESWRREASESVLVKQAVFGNTPPRAGEMWRLRVHEGRLGYPWVESAQRVPAGEAGNPPKPRP